MANPDTIRLWGTETRIPIAAKFPVEYALPVKKGEKERLIRYTVVILKAK